MAIKARAKGKQAITRRFLIAAALAGGICAPAFFWATASRASAPAPAHAGQNPAASPAHLREPGAMMDRAAQSGSMVYVDDSFASVDQLRNAIRAANQGQSELAINTFQGIVDQFGQKLVYLDDNSYMSITDYVRQRLLAMPAVKSGMYDQLFGGTAQKEIDAATENHDLAALIRICDRYYPSTAALKGLILAGEWYFERGEFTAAARTWKELLAHPMLGDKAPELLFRCAAAEALAGDRTAAKNLRDRLDKDSPNATGSISGKDKPLVPELDGILAGPPWEKVDLSPDEWPAFGGGADHATLLKSSATIGAQLWSVDMGEAPSAPVGTSGNVDLQRAMLIARLQAGIPIGALQLSQLQGGGGGPASFPVISNGTLYLQLNGYLVALSANAGTPLWTFPAGGAGLLISGQDADRSPAINAPRPSPPGPNVPTVYGDQVFALLPGSGPMNNGFSGYMVACLSRDTGRPIWTKSSTDISAGQPSPISLIGSPIVSRQGVFILGEKASDQSFTQHFLIRLDRQTGAVDWVCYLCSTSTALSLNSSAILPTLADDVLYVCTGQGADCAIDANVGRILWLRITAADTGNNRNNFTRMNVQSISDAWRLNPPVIAGDHVIMADQTSGLFVYDRQDGTLAGHIAGADLGLDRIDVVAGIVDGNLVLTGSASNSQTRTVALPVDALDRQNISPAWASDISGTANGTGALHGRPFLTQTGYYLPFEKKLVRIDVQNGQADEPTDWPHDEKNNPGKPGNLLVTSEQVVVSSENGIAGYSRWETARDNRLENIRQHPDDPAAYLALAEISFRTNHQDLAQQNMKRAVDLANHAAAGASDGTTPDILRRLYRTNFAFAEQLLVNPDDTQRDLSRFYYQQCQATARDPEQQAQWRLRLAELASRQKNPDEAAELYKEVLVEPALRAAAYPQSESGQSAGGTAELKMAAIKAGFPAAYKRFEDQAAALNQRATTAHDAAGLQAVMDGYPNSEAAKSAASTLSATELDQKDWTGALHSLRWLEPLETTAADRAHITQEIATAYIGLKKYGSAFEWASHGQRQDPAYSWKADGGKTLTFASLRDQIIAAGGTDIVGRLPAWPGTAAHDISESESPLSDGNLLAGNSQLLAPVETALQLRQPNLVFLRTDDVLRIYDTDKHANLASEIRLPQRESAVLLGATSETAILLQRNYAMGVDLKTGKNWKHELGGYGSARIVQGAVMNGPGQMRITVSDRRMVQVVGDQVIINGVNAYARGSVVIFDTSGHQINLDGGAAGDSRRAAFASLGEPIGFESARLVDGKLILLIASHIEALDMDDGADAWRDTSGNPVLGHLPDGGVPRDVLGNQDLVLVQVDSSSDQNAVSTFYGFDAGTGRPRGSVAVTDAGGPAIWSTLGDDSRLFVQTQKGIAAYDFASGNKLWQHNVDPRFAGATTLTLNGLICVGQNDAPQCLSPDTGQPRWPDNLTTGLPISPVIVPDSQSLRAYADGDNLFLESSAGSAVLSTAQAQPQASQQRGGEQLMYPRGEAPPPLQSLQFSNVCFVELGAGNTGNGTDSTQLIFHDRNNFLLKGGIRLHAPGNPAASPNIRSWQVVDGGIVLDVSDSGGADAPGTVYFWPYPAQ